MPSKKMINDIPGMCRRLDISKGIIAIEGLDGTGKSLISRVIAKELGALQTSTPAPPYGNLRLLLHDRRGSESLLLYLSSVAYEISNWLEDEHPILIIDRFWISTILHHLWKQIDSSLTGQQTLRNWFDIISCIIPEPHVIVNLTCERSERLRRIQKRHNSTIRDIMDIQYDNFWIDSNRIIRDSYHGHWIEYDTTETDSETAGIAIAELIRKCVKSNNIIDMKKTEVLFVIGSPASGKTTLINTIQTLMLKRGIKTATLDDKTALINLCLTDGEEGKDYSVSTSGTICWICQNILEKRIESYAKLINNVVAFSDVLLVEFSSLNYATDLKKLFDMVIHARFNTVLLTGREEVMIERNRKRPEGNHMNRAIPESYINQYFKSKVSNESFHKGMRICTKDMQDVKSAAEKCIGELKL